MVLEQGSIVIRMMAVAAEQRKHRWGPLGRLCTGSRCEFPPFGPESGAEDGGERAGSRNFGSRVASRPCLCAALRAPRAPFILSGPFPAPFAKLSRLLFQDKLSVDVAQALGSMPRVIPKIVQIFVALSTSISPDMCCGSKWRGGRGRQVTDARSRPRAARGGLSRSEAEAGAE